MTVRDESTLVRVKRELVAKAAQRAADEGISIRQCVENILKSELEKEVQG
jgi:predicted HicB family RNase H-like nuclease